MYLYLYKTLSTEAPCYMIDARRPDSDSRNMSHSGITHRGIRGLERRHHAELESREKVLTHFIVIKQTILYKIRITKELFIKLLRKEALVENYTDLNVTGNME